MAQPDPEMLEETVIALDLTACRQNEKSYLSLAYSWPLLGWPNKPMRTRLNQK
jgi:hypothetical protein